MRSARVGDIGAMSALLKSGANIHDQDGLVRCSYLKIVIPLDGLTMSMPHPYLSISTVRQPSATPVRAAVQRRRGFSSRTERS